jgi:lipoprotein-anchoring transpeptidase ErfK/SrfK
VRRRSLPVVLLGAALVMGAAAGFRVSALAAVDPTTCPAWVPDPTATGTTSTTTSPATAAPPQAVTVTVATTLVGSTSAVVAGSLAGASGPAQVTVVSWRSGGVADCTPAQTVAGSALRLDVAGLQPATGYQFELVANAVAGTAIGASSAATLVTLPQGTVAQGVVAGRTVLGGLTRSDARSRLVRATGVPLHFTYNGVFWRATPAQLGARFLVGRTLTAALDAQPGVTLPAPAIRIDGAVPRAYVARLGRRYGHPPVSARVSLVGAHAVVAGPRPGVRLQQNALVAAIEHELLHGTRTRLRLPMHATPALQAPSSKAVVVRLGSQTLTAYLNGKPILTTPVTTGRPALPTPIGSFSVQFKASPYVFHSPWPPGNAYWYPPTPVTWAMEFYGGDFLHDDPAEPGDAFGSDSQNGYFASHGCVHVPHDAMAFLYGWLPVGAPVVVSQS